MDLKIWQHPCEKITLEFKTRCMESSYNSKVYQCDLSLSFENESSEPPSDNLYKITMFALLGNTHVKIISFKKRKVDGDIRLENIEISPFLFGPVAEPNFRNFAHFCFEITRYDEDETNVGALLFKNGFYSDVALVVGDNELKAHKHVLASRSAVFESMFAQKILQGVAEIVTIDNFDFEVVEEMLYYIYTGKVRNISRFPLELYQLAHRYDLDDLKLECEVQISLGINEMSAVSVLQMADINGMNILRSKVEEFIRDNEDKMAKEDSYHTFVRSHFELDTIIDTLKFCAKYEEDMHNVKISAFEFIKQYGKTITSDPKFLDLFYTHPKIMKDFHIYNLHSEY